MQVDQALFGYKGGHRRLASSHAFHPGDERFLVRMTDLSGSRLVPGYEEYISGYSLPSEGAYAFAKTWYAPECERPGCVWTQVLFISEDLWNKLDPNSVCSLFERPDPNGVNLERYSRSLDVERSDLSCDPLPQQAEYKSIIAHLYSDALPVLIPEDNSRVDLDQLLMRLVWQRPLPFRRSLSFCTGALSYLTTEEGPVRVQVMPSRVLKTVREDVHRLSGGFEHEWPAWVNVLADDLVIRDSLLRNLFGQHRYGLERYSEKEAVDTIRALAELRTSLARYEAGRCNTTDLLEETARVISDPHDQAEFKQAVLLAVTRSPSGRLDLINFVIADAKHGSAFTGNEVLIGQAAADVAMEDSMAALQILGQYLFRPNSSYVQQTISTLLSKIDIKQLKPASPVDSQILFAIAREQRSVILDPTFWLLQQNFEESAELADALVEGIGEEDVLTALLFVGRFDLLIRMLRLRGSQGAYEAFRLARSLQLEREEDYQKLLALRGEISDFSQSIVWEIQRRREQCNSSQVFLLSSANIDPSTLAGLAPDRKLWVEAISALPQQLERIHAVAFYLGCGETFPDGWTLFPRSFDLLHEAISEKRLPSEWWWFLKTRLPSLAIWEKWDRCERLRRGLVDVFRRRNLPPALLRECTKHDWLYRRLLEMYMAR